MRRPALHRLSASLGIRLPVLAYLHDMGMAALAFLVALLVRLGMDQYESPETQGLIPVAVPLFVAVCAVVFPAMRLYRGLWRYASIRDMVTVAQAVTIAILAFLPLLFAVNRLEAFPRSLPPILWLLLLTFLSVPRFAYRAIKDGRLSIGQEPLWKAATPVLLVGAGDGAELFIRAMAGDRAASYRVVGVLDEDRRLAGRKMHGVAILGGADRLEAIVDRLSRQGRRPQRLILTQAAGKVDGEMVRRLVEAADALGLTLGRLPSLTEFKDAMAEGGAVLRPVPVEDLLGRPQVALDKGPVKALIAGRRVAVTGAGGTIGSELVRQVAALGPARLALLDNGEFNLYRIDLELAETVPALPRAAHLVDVRNRGRVAACFGEERPEVVFHAAALKHVPLVEQNPAEGVLTNVVGTRNVADAARTVGARVMVLISTDKAVEPANVMGASKRLAETYAQALDLSAGAGETRFVTVRFGNVLGSTGSVVPLFERQLARGGPLTVTHKDVERYFMTCREAVSLVLQAAAHGIASRDEQGKILVLDMGTPVKIVDLARQMIRLAGLRPDRDVQIAFTGMRPGEKMTERLFDTAEPPGPTALAGLLVASPRAADPALVRRTIDELEQACLTGDTGRVIAILRRVLPEFRPEGAEEAAALGG